MKTAIVFVHFDTSNVVKDYVMYYLQELRKLSSHITFVSTSSLPKNQIAKVNNLCSQVIIRENLGYDFFSYKVGLDIIKPLSDWDEIILCNDSVYAPIYPFEAMFGTMRRMSCDFWGPTISFEITKHLQSYFMVFNKRCFENSYFQTFWSNLEVINNRDQVIDKYEIGLSNHLFSHGMQSGAYLQTIKPWNYFYIILALCNILLQQIRMRNFSNLIMYILTGNLDNIKINPTIALWKALIQLKVPFLKKSVVRKFEKENRQSIVLEEISKYSNYNNEFLK